MNSGDQTLFDFEVPNIDGQTIQFSSLKGKKAYIVVNVACECGLAPDSYSQLVELYTKYSPLGLEILAFPSNSFKQENQTEPQIKANVSKQYGVTFPLFTKIEVNGENTHPLYLFLKKNSTLPKDIPFWNFAKFLLNSEGKVVEFFNQRQKPLEMIPSINKLLGIE